MRSIKQLTTLGDVQRTSFRDMNCSIAQCLEAVGEWWSMLIVRDVFFGVTRFDELQARLGVSRNILNRRLRHLVAEGVLERVPYQERPPRYDYVLTPKGRDLWVVLTAMREWGDRWAAPAGPPVEMVHRTCGHRARMQPTCSACHEPLRGADVQPVLGPGADDPSFLPARTRETGARVDG
ncbi:MAG TPA: helix-turn-helix domain-containing protein [Acidimicrobiales bacterium]